MDKSAPGGVSIKPLPYLMAKTIAGMKHLGNAKNVLGAAIGGSRVINEVIAIATKLPPPSNLVIVKAARPAGVISFPAGVGVKASGDTQIVGGLPVAATGFAIEDLRTSPLDDAAKEARKAKWRWTNFSSYAASYGVLFSAGGEVADGAWFPPDDTRGLSGMQEVTTTWERGVTSTLIVSSIPDDIAELNEDGKKGGTLFAGGACFASPNDMPGFFGIRRHPTAKVMDYVHFHIAPDQIPDIFDGAKWLADPVQPRSEVLWALNNSGDVLPPRQGDAPTHVGVPVFSAACYVVRGAKGEYDTAVVVTTLAWGDFEDLDKIPQDTLRDLQGFAEEMGEGDEDLHMDVYPYTFEARGSDWVRAAGADFSPKILVQAANETTTQYLTTPVFPRPLESSVGFGAAAFALQISITDARTTTEYPSQRQMTLLSSACTQLKDCTELGEIRDVEFKQVPKYDFTYDPEDPGGPPDIPENALGSGPIYQEVLGMASACFQPLFTPNPNLPVPPARIIAAAVFANDATDYNPEYYDIVTPTAVCIQEYTCTPSGVSAAEKTVEYVIENRVLATDAYYGTYSSPGFYESPYGVVTVLDPEDPELEEAIAAAYPPYARPLVSNNGGDAVVITTVTCKHQQAIGSDLLYIPGWDAGAGSEQYILLRVLDLEDITYNVLVPAADTTRRLTLPLTNTPLPALAYLAYANVIVWAGASPHYTTGVGEKFTSLPSTSQRTFVKLNEYIYAVLTASVEGLSEPPMNSKTMQLQLEVFDDAGAIMNTYAVPYETLETERFDNGIPIGLAGQFQLSRLFHETPVRPGAERLRDGVLVVTYHRPSILNDLSQSTAGTANAGWSIISTDSGETWNRFMPNLEGPVDFLGNMLYSREMRNSEGYSSGGI